MPAKYTDKDGRAIDAPYNPGQLGAELEKTALPETQMSLVPRELPPSKEDVLKEVLSPDTDEDGLYDLMHFRYCQSILEPNGKLVVVGTR